MYRQYFRVFKLPCDVKVLFSNHCVNNKGYKLLQVRRFVCCHNRLNPIGGVCQIGSAFSNVCRPIPTAFSSRCYCQKNSITDNISVENLEAATSSKTSSTSIVLDTQEQTNASQNPCVDQSDLFEDIDYDQITGGDEDKLNKFKLLMLEIDVLRQDGMKVPTKMSTNEWKELFELQSRSQRWKYLTFLFKIEMKKLGDKRRKERKRMARADKLDEPSSDASSMNDQLTYGFRGSTIFIRMYDSTINFYDNYRLIRAMMFGQDLIIDCGFYNDMNTMENKLCAKQLVYLFAENRLSKEPFNLHFCNLKKNTSLYEHFKRHIPTMEDLTYPINVYEEHYLDIFPKEKLVYLTPHCRTELNEYNHDDIYIIGAIVDKVNQHPLTLAKAKSEGLRMAKFPLDRYLDWSIGTKSLTINQCVNILHDAQVTGDWNIAFKHVPKRKIRQPDETARDPRTPWKRGTTLQPPQRFIKYY